VFDLLLKPYWYLSRIPLLRRRLISSLLSFQNRPIILHMTRITALEYWYYLAYLQGIGIETFLHGLINDFRKHRCNLLIHVFIIAVGIPSIPVEVMFFKPLIIFRTLLSVVSIRMSSPPFSTGKLHGICGISARISSTTDVK
jgi:hypothetical protein